jgi:hypothetical protein
MSTASRRCLTVRPSQAGQIRAFALFALSAALAGCTLAPPQPWEKGNLARPEMSMNADPLEQRFSQHIYTSKENASGGYGVGGGGCGCN